MKYGQINTSGGIFTYLRNALTSDYSLPGARDIDYILKVMSSKVEVTDYFSGGGVLIDGSPSETIVLRCFCDEFNLNCNVHMHVFSASRLVKRCTVICCLPIVIKCL